MLLRRPRNSALAGAPRLWQLKNGVSRHHLTYEMNQTCPVVVQYVDTVQLADQLVNSTEQGQ